HFYRNVFSHVPSTKVREITHMLTAIHAQENRKAAQEKGKRPVRLPFRFACSVKVTELDTSLIP
ncbi:MAG: hypothetical protein AAGC96_15650, partial [Pseudomonadota bacterium]